MEDEGLLKRTHGGAISNPKTRNKPQHHSNRYGEGDSRQISIAKEAVQYIKSDDTKNRNVKMILAVIRFLM
jgi:DeoR family transcriptional regulator, fructose operon transcriptional repressor